MKKKNHLKNITCPNQDCPHFNQFANENIILHSFYKTSQGRRRRYRCKTARHDLLRGKILERMSQRNTSNRNPSMPPLGTELVDEKGVEVVKKMIDELIAGGH